MTPLPTAWFENIHGTRWFPSTHLATPPPGYDFEWARASRVLAEQLFVGGIAKETRWRTWSADLVSALHRPSLAERTRALLRGFSPIWGMPLGDAIVIAAVACQQCRIRIAYRHGVSWGIRQPGHPMQRGCEICEASR